MADGLLHKLFIKKRQSEDVKLKNRLTGSRGLLQNGISRLDGPVPLAIARHLKRGWCPV
jgi:hypothetical protein